MFNWLLNTISNKTTQDLTPEGYGNGINHESFTLFLIFSLISFLLLVLVWGIMYSKLSKLREENEDLKKEIEKLKNPKSE